MQAYSLSFSVYEGGCADRAGTATRLCKGETLLRVIAVRWVCVASNLDVSFFQGRGGGMLSCSFGSVREEALISLADLRRASHISLGRGAFGGAFSSGGNLKGVMLLHSLVERAQYVSNAAAAEHSGFLHEHGLTIDTTTRLPCKILGRTRNRRAAQQRLSMLRQTSAPSPKRSPSGHHSSGFYLSLK